VPEEGGPDCLGKNLAEYLLDENNESLDTFVLDNKMEPVTGTKIAVWIYIVDMENKSVELDGTVYDYNEFNARCCMDSMQLPYFALESARTSYENLETPRTSMFNAILNFEPKSARPSRFGQSIGNEHESLMRLTSSDFYAARSFSLEKDEPVLKI
jgi:hypothetical protein